MAAASQFAFNTLSRVTPVAHGVCNVVKRVCIIGTSVIFFGNKMTDQTKLGTVIALIGENFVCKALCGDHARCSPSCVQVSSNTGGGGVVGGGGGGEALAAGMASSCHATLASLDPRSPESIEQHACNSILPRGHVLRANQSPAL